MTTDEIVRALRCISTPEITHLCTGCKYRKSNGCDADEVNKDAIRLIEQLCVGKTQLRKEVEWKDMVIALAQRKQAEAEAERDAAIADLKISNGCTSCKYYCTDTTTCEDCTKKKNCKCIGCGIRQNNWEWRGLPEAPEEGEKDV